jgi:hypothetical protein
LIDAFLPLDRFFGGVGLWLLWATGNLVLGAGVVVVAIVGALVVRGVRFLIKR